MFGKAILKFIFLAINLIAFFFMLMALIGTVLSPAVFVFPAYFALFFPFIVALNIGLVIFWLLARKWYFLISLVILLFSSTMINETFPVHVGKRPPVRTPQPIRILTYNTMVSGKLVKHTRKKPNNVIQYILDADADIVCMQEFTVSNKDEYLTKADIMRIFSKYPYKHIEYQQKGKLKHSGVATFSKFPIVNKQEIHFPSRYNISIFTDINIYGKTIRLVNNHLESNRLTGDDKNMPLILKDKFDTENLTDITRQFSRKLGAAYKLRAAQADAVARVIEASPYSVIVCGDLNDVPVSYTYKKIKGKLNDAFVETGTGFGWTFRERFYRFRIDYVFYDPATFVLVDYKTDKVRFSDHLPVICELGVK